MIKTAASFLFENKTTKQTIFKNTFWIVLSAGICKTLRAVIIIYIARVLGPGEYGKFAFALAFVSLFVSFFDMGLPLIMTREFAKGKAGKKEFDSIFSLRILLGLGNIFLVFLLSFLLSLDSEVQKLIWILIGASFLGQFPEIFYAYFRSKEKMEYESFANIFQVILLFIFVLAVILKFLSPINISWAYLGANLMALLAVSFFFYCCSMPLKISFAPKIWKNFLIMSLPLALTSLFSMIYGYFDSTILGFTKQIEGVGYYNAALKIINIAVLPAGIISMVFYPPLSRFWEENREKFRKVFNYQMTAIICLSFLIIFLGIIFSSKIIEFLYGKEYLPAVPALKILIIMAGFSYFYSVLSQVLIAIGKQWQMFQITFLGALANIILNIILIPSSGFIGAAQASLATMFFMVILSYWFFRRAYVFAQEE